MAERSMPLFPEVIADGFRLYAGQNCLQRRRVRLPDSLQAAEVFEEASSCTLTHAGNFQEFGGAIAHLAALAMEGYGEAVGFVPNELNQMQYGGVVVERDGVFFLSIDVKNFFAFSNGGERLIDDLMRFQGLGCRVKLPQASIDEHQAGHRLFFLQKAFIAACDYLAHGSKIVHTLDRADDELAVVRFLHLAIFPDHHGGHSLRALDVRNVEALDALGEFGQAENFLQFFLNGLGIGLELAKALIVGLFGVGAG